tara:strand:- start:52 stop:279 length:228 start_codon:yes stop_codon:yes gene_type:complete
MCLSAPKAPSAPIQRVAAPVVSQAVEAVERPIELVTADKDMKKKKKRVIKSGKSALTTSLALNTATEPSGVNYSA